MMRDATTSLTLWLPGLLSPQRVLESSENLSSEDMPHLKQLLAKADRLPMKMQGFYQTASYLFHQPSTLPPAATMASIEIDGFDADAFWLRMDPAQMIPDRDSLVLIPPSELAISDEEAKALIDTFNQHFEEDRVRLEFGSADHWYLRIAQAVDLHTSPLDEVAFQHLGQAFPTGNAAHYWRQLMNEVQMLFFDHPVNQSRREQGIPEINSIWPWGEGLLDMAQIKHRPSAHIWSTHPYLQGMSGLSGAATHAAPESYMDWLNQLDVETGGHHLVLLETSLNALSGWTLPQWLEALKLMEESWFSEILNGLKSGRLQSVLLDFGMGYRYHLEPKHMKRFWRRKRSLTHFVAQT